VSLDKSLSELPPGLLLESSVMYVSLLKALGGKDPNLICLVVALMLKNLLVTARTNDRAMLLEMVHLAIKEAGEE
jgi:hypothetical protein